MKINGNLTFLGQGVAENLRLEALASDPGGAMEQQLWVNTTDAKVRTKIGTDIVTFATEAQLNDLQTEVNRVETGVGLDSDGNFVSFGTTTNYLGGATSIVSSLTLLDSAAFSNAGAILSEKTRAMGVESDLQSEVNRVETAVGLDANGDFVSFGTTTNYLATASSVVSSLTLLDAQAFTNAGAILTEKTRAIGIENGLDTRVNTLETTYINKDGSVAFTGNINANSHLVNNVSNPVENGDAANKWYVDDAISKLGNVFEYVGTVAGGADSGSAFDMATKTQKDTGDYYKITTGGYFKVGNGTPFFAKTGDGLIFNISGEIDIIDNTNSQVLETTNFTKVTGDSDVGFTVDIADNFKTRVNTLESGLENEISRATGIEGGLQTEINHVETAVGLDANGDFVSFGTATNYLAGATSIVSSLTLLDSQAKTNSNDILIEKTRALGIEADLQSEVNRVESAVGLDANGDFVSFGTTTNYLAAATSVVSSLTTLDQALSDLAGQVGDCFVVYTSGANATSHEFTHNLGTKFVNVTVVDVDDKVIIPQEIVFNSVNMLTVTFNSSIGCKIIVAGKKVV